MSGLDTLRVFLMTDPAGEVDSLPSRRAVVSIHVGPTNEVGCRRDGRYHRGLSVHGDIDIIPPGTPSRWELKEEDTALILALPSAALAAASEEAGLELSRLQIVNRFQIRDPRIEHIGWALKAEMETGHRGGRLYFEGLSMALAAALLDRHSSAAPAAKEYFYGMSGHRLRRVLSYIEDNLSQNLSLKEIADVAGLSISHCKTAFTKSVGSSIHQYVIQRRVERARRLLTESRLSISQVAAESGFTHKSHLAYHTRRVFGAAPSRLRDYAQGH